MPVSCFCDKNSSCQKIGTYRHLAQEDIHYLHEMGIYQCPACDLAFAHPMPSSEDLNQYYKEVYRRPGRPHHVDNPESKRPNFWHKSQFAYVSQFVDFNKIQSAIDIGSGYGFLLRVFREYLPHIRLYATDLDPINQQYLQTYNIPSIDLDGPDSTIDGQMDLVMSCHVLEHFSNPNDFFLLCRKYINKGGYLFIEVPNCPFEDGFYQNRPYDGPHLLFFTLKSLSYYLHKHGFSIIHLATNGFTFEQYLDEARRQYHLLNSPAINRNIKSKIKHMLPPFIKNSWKAIKQCNAGFSSNEEPFMYYGGNRWSLRAMAVKTDKT